MNERKEDQTKDDQTEESILSYLKITDNYASKQNNVNKIDYFSTKCLVCHDEVNAKMGEVVIKDNPGNKRIRQLASNHPIGMTYNRYASHGKGFKSTALFNNNIKLFDGKVGCLTCHNPINPEKRHLVMSDAKSALCLTCHDK